MTVQRRSYATLEERAAIIGEMKDAGMRLAEEANVFTKANGSEKSNILTFSDEPERKDEAKPNLARRVEELERVVASLLERLPPP